MNQWVKGFCRKREKISCGKCDARKFVPVSDNIIAGHLKGIDVVKNTGGDFTIGVYPLLLDETCWFLAVDFDKDTWKDDSVAYIEVCEYSMSLRRLRDPDQEMEGMYGFSLQKRFPQNLRVNSDLTC